MFTENKSKIIVAAESALKSIKDWRSKECGSTLTDADKNIGQNLIKLSLLPPLNQELLQKTLGAAIESDGEVPLALHAVGCLNFIGGGEEAHIARITGKSKRWKRFSQEELPSMLEVFAKQGIRVAMGFCISDLGDFIDNTQQDKDNIEQNVAAMRRDLDQTQKVLKKKWGSNSPEIRVSRHRDVFENGPVGTTFDRMFASDSINHDDVSLLRSWLLENAVTPETDPFLIHAPEDEAVFQIFASGVLYAADIASSAAVMQEQFPAEGFEGTVMLNLFPDYKTDAILQRVFTEILVPKSQQTAVISPFANAGRWESDPVTPTDFGDAPSELPARKSLSPEEIFNGIMGLNDDNFKGEKPFDEKISVAKGLVAQIFGRDTADQCLADINAIRLARFGSDKSVNLPIVEVGERQSLTMVVAKAHGVSLSEATRLIAGGAVRIDGQKIIVSGEGNRRALAGQIVFPTNASVMSVGKQRAWRVKLEGGK
jgi:hypothetical protein